MKKTINEHRAASTLNKKMRYPEGVMTRREWLNMWRVKGATVEEKQVRNYAAEEKLKASIDSRKWSIPWGNDRHPLTMAWNEEHDIFGYVGRSTGENKIPLLVANFRSYGGGALLDHCIIKIRESKGNRVLYQAANFQQPVIEVKEATENLGQYSHELFIDGQLYSRHKSLKSAEMLKKKLS